MIRDYSQEAEDKLIEAAMMNGDSTAFGELVRRYYAGLVTMIYRLCGDSALAEDMAQETFLRAWINLPSFRLTAPLRNWLYRIAVNVTLDTLRRHKTVAEYNEELQAGDQTVNPEAALLAREQARQVQQAIASLPDAARIVLVLREYGGLSYREIAETLDIPIGTVMSRLNYARDHLRRSLLRVV